MRKLANEELSRLSKEEFMASPKLPVIVVLDNVRSLHNVGSVFRTADAFLLGGIYICGITAKPPHREIHKTALGAEENVTWKYFSETTEAISELKNSGYQIIAVEQADKSISLNEYEVKSKEKVALVFGNEIFGVGEEVMKMIDGCIEIPQSGTKHSLNISVSVGVVAWEFWKKIQAREKSEV